MARTLFRHARMPKEFWVVEGAKHNQALQTAGDEYRRRVLAFFVQHLADPTGAGGEWRQEAGAKRLKGPTGLQDAKPGKVASAS